jgi:leader peptidase (prepilin peptidase)/N-methyltransferase
LVEIITPLVFVALFWKFGTDLVLFAKYAVFMAFLIPIFFIDLYHRLILDKLTIPMAVIGLGFSLLPSTDIGFLNALLTGLGILVLMLVIAWLFEKIKNKEGMGGGDIKLLAAMATYLGVMHISFIVFFSSILAVIVAISTSRNREHGIPFGPFLAISAFGWIMFGEYFLGWYFSLL